MRDADEYPPPVPHADRRTIAMLRAAARNWQTDSDVLSRLFSRHGDYPLHPVDILVPGDLVGCPAELVLFGVLRDLRTAQIANE